MSRHHDLEKALELFPIVRGALDPDISSVYLQAILRNIHEYADASRAWLDKYTDRLDARDMTEDELDECRRESSPLDSQARDVKMALHVLKGCHETMGLTPDELHKLAERYGVEAYGGLPSWEMVQEIQEKAFMSRLRSDSALKRSPTVSDEQIKLVVSNCEGQEAQARTLGISVRQLQRRLKKINEKS